MASRFSIILVALLVAYAFLGFHLYQLQLVKGGYYYAKAESELSASASNNGNRGAIYFTDNQGNTLPAALDQQFPVIYADPAVIKDPSGAAARVAPILKMTVSALTKTFSKKDQYEWLLNKADQSTAQQIEDLNIAGVVTDFEPERFYPLSTVASQILGYVGPNSSNSGE